MRLPPALFDRQYRIYVLGNFFSLQALWAKRTVIAWLAWDLTGSAATVGFIAFLSFAPTLVSGPIFGVLADRVDLKRALIVCQAAMATIAAVLFVFLISDAISIEVLAAIALAQGIVISAHHPVRLALTPRVTPRAALANAIAISSLNFNFARLTGPVLGGYGVAVLGAAGTMGAAFCLFLPAFVSMIWVVPRAADGAAARPVGMLAALTEGARRAWSDPPIRAAMALTAIFAVIVRGVLELLPVIADGVFQRGPSGLGELMAAAGAGALIAAIWLTGEDLVTEARVPRITLCAIFGGFGAVAALTLAPVWPVALLLTALMGFCGTMVGVTMQSVVQMSLDDGHRGRVMSLWIMVGVGSAALGALAMGAAAEWAGFRPTLIFSALAGAMIAAGALLDQRRRSSRSNASRNRDLSALEKGRPPPP